ncbi:hypothetical protein GGH14_006549, partial [Coemansia sp. RSA 370]
PRPALTRVLPQSEQEVFSAGIGSNCMVRADCSVLGSAGSGKCAVLSSPVRVPTRQLATAVTRKRAPLYCVASARPKAENGVRRVALPTASPHYNCTQTLITALLAALEP